MQKLRLDKLQERKVLAAFQRAARQTPFYKKLLKRSRVSAKSIKTIADFKHSVPLLDRNSLFTERHSDISTLFPDGNLADCQSIFPGSGSSGHFSFGLIPKKGSATMGKALDTALDVAFSTSKKRTLVLNVLHMGLNVPSQNVVIVNTGLRSDTAINILKTFGQKFDQQVIVGDCVFIKKLIEDSIEQGLDWTNLSANVIFVGEGFPESFREYIEHLLSSTEPGKTRKANLIASSFGFAEIGFNVLWETPEVIQLRKNAYKDSNFLKALLGKETPICPLFFTYNPLTVFVEEHNGQLLFTDLNKHAQLPIIRYATGDKGSVIPFHKVKKVLTDFGVKGNLSDQMFNLVALQSRSHFIEINSCRIYPDAIKDIFYFDHEMAKVITGYFKMRKVNSKLFIDFQLRKGTHLTQEISNRFITTIEKHLSACGAISHNPNGSNFDISLYNYNDFPYAMELDYGRKFSYI